MSKENVVILSDYDPKAVKNFVRFIYTGTLEADPPFRLILDLFRLAHAYEVDKLMTETSDRLESVINEKNVLEILRTAHLHQATDLKEVAMHFLLSCLRGRRSVQGIQEFAQAHGDIMIDLVRPVL